MVREIEQKQEDNFMENKKKVPAPGEIEGLIPLWREELISRWETVLKDYRDSFILDVANFKHLVFDTYSYFYQFKDYNMVLREDLKIYKYAVQFIGGNDYPNNCEQYAFETCLDFAAGLCLSIENGFQRGYRKISLPLDNLYHIPAGCSASEVDMSSYETYEKAFRRALVDCMREHMEDDELDEQEELRKIASLKDASEE